MYYCLIAGKYIVGLNYIFNTFYENESTEIPISFKASKFKTYAFYNLYKSYILFFLTTNCIFILTFAVNYFAINILINLGFHKFNVTVTFY